MAALVLDVMLIFFVRLSSISRGIHAPVELTCISLSIQHRGLAAPTLGLETLPATSSRGRQRKFRCNCIPPLQPKEPRLPLGLAPAIMRPPG